MTTWAEFCAGSGKDSQAVLSLRLRVPMGPQLVRQGGCCIAKCSLYSVGIPSCFPTDFPGDAEKGWNGSLTHAFVLEQPRTEVRNAGEGLVNLGAAEGYHFCPLGFKM